MEEFDGPGGGVRSLALPGFKCRSIGYRRFDRRDLVERYPA